MNGEKKSAGTRTRYEEGRFVATLLRMTTFVGSSVFAGAEALDDFGDEFLGVAEKHECFV